MKMISFVMILVMAGFLAGLPGCSEKQLQDADNVLADANSVAEGLAEIADGPAGSLLPARVRTGLEIVAGLTVMGVGLWKQGRHNLTRTTLKAVAKGVDRLDMSKGQEVKESVGGEMNRLARARPSLTYVMLNAELDKAKATL